MHAAVLLFGGITEKAWGDLLYSVETGEPAFHHVFGMDSFSYMAQHPNEAANFDKAMSDFTRQIAIAVAGAYNFSTLRTIVDVGGGDGTLLVGILSANPSLRGILFEQAHVAERAKEQIKFSGLTARCAVVAGDFFHTVPDGGNAYILKHVIHDWDDKRATNFSETVAARWMQRAGCSSSRVSIHRASFPRMSAVALPPTMSTCWSALAGDSAPRTSSVRCSSRPASG
jgi:O-methyltransferase domain